MSEREDLHRKAQGYREPLREAFNVEDAKQRDRIVRRFHKIRANAVLEKHTCEHWNRTHPTEPPLDVTLWGKVIAWCDGNGPMPTKLDI